MNKQSLQALEKAIGRRIESITLDNVTYPNTLVLRFTDGTGLRIEDNGQECCENRYMTLDDATAPFIGAAFLGIEVKPVIEPEGEYNYSHEIAFLEIQTAIGCFTLANHNEHNGYYGGFYIVVKALEKGE